MTGRREFLSRGGMAALGLPWLARGAPARNAAARDARRPNVLFIMTDQQHAGMMSCTGNAWLNTPAMDRLAASGIRFERAYACNPVCVPNRFSLQTGHMPSAVGMSQNNSKIAVPVNMTEQSLGMLFRNAGYETVYGGKVHLPGNLTAAIRKSGYRFLKGGARQGLADACVEYLRTPHDKPFFQAVGIFRPHIPWFAPRACFNRYPLDKVFLPEMLEGDLEDCSPVALRWLRRRWHEWLVENDLWRGAVQGYLACISFSDSQVGRLLDALDRSPYADNTIVVLWSDHGMHIGEKNHWEKFTLWEESTRVPLIVVAPGVSKSAARCDRPASLLDIYPTLIELCGLPPAEGIEGISLVPLLRDPTAARKQPAIITWGLNNHAVRTDRWRYIRYHNGDEELYDHQTDANEFTNLAKKDPEKWRPLMKQLSQWLPKVNAPQVSR